MYTHYLAAENTGDNRPKPKSSNRRPGPHNSIESELSADLVYCTGLHIDCGATASSLLLVVYLRLECHVSVRCTLRIHNSADKSVICARITGHHPQVRKLLIPHSFATNGLLPRHANAKKRYSEVRRTKS